MTREAKRNIGDLRLLLQFTRETSASEGVEQVYAAALTLVQGIFTPDRAFVALTESSNAISDIPSLHPGWLSDLAVPIHAGEKSMGRIMLQYDERRAFSDQDLAVIELIAAQCGFFIQRIHERTAANEIQRQKHELVAMAAHELRSPLTAIIGAAVLLRTGRDNERVRAVDIIERNARAQVTLIEELLHVC